MARVWDLAPTCFRCLPIWRPTHPVQGLVDLKISLQAHLLPVKACSRSACPSRERVLSSSLAHCRALIPMHRDLRLSGQLPPLDAPHHMRATEWGVFREGVVLSSAPGAGSLLEIGLDKVCSYPSSLSGWVEVACRSRMLCLARSLPEMGVDHCMHSQEDPTQTCAQIKRITYRICAAHRAAVVVCEQLPIAAHAAAACMQPGWLD